MVKREAIALVLLVFCLSAVSALSITSPTNTSYGVDITDLTYNSDGDVFDVCEYSMDGGQNNLSDFNAVPSIEGTNTINLYCQNTTNGLKDAAQITYWQDSVFPVLNMNYPTTSPIYLAQDYFNVNTTIIETNTDTLTFKVTAGARSITETRPYLNGISESFRFPSFGSVPNDNYTYTMTANDTMNHIFTYIGQVILDAIPPIPSIDYPSNMDLLSGEITIQTSATDDRSGVAQIDILIEQGAYSDSSSCASDSCDYTWDSILVLEGLVNITTTATDNAGNSDSTMIVIQIDNTPPVINLTGANPQTIEVLTGTYTELGAVALDNIDGDISGEIIVDSSAVNINVIGSYQVTYNVQDTAGNDAIEVMRTVNVVDTIVPVIILTGDNPQTVELGGVYVEQGATASDNYDGDISGSILIDASAVNTGIIGPYNVTYDVSDSSANPAIQLIRTVDVTDTTPPTITLNIGNNTPFAEGTDVLINLGITDFSGIGNCSLFLDGIFNQNNTGQNFTISGLSAGQYEYYINCTDLLNNQGSSTTQYFTVLANLSQAADFTDYTNLSAESDISNVIGFFVANQYGMINWTDSIDFSAGKDWSKYISITEYNMQVNLTAMPEFVNKTAILTYYNITFSTPQIMEDEVISTNYVNYSYNINIDILSITVDELSRYRVRETPTPPAPLLSSGGGGGGTYTPPPEEQPGCSVDSWNCTDWSDCINETETRTCQVFPDFDHCKGKYKPDETQECGTGGLFGEEEEEGQGLLAGITGAVIGTTAGKIGLGVLILIIIGGVAYLVSRKIKAKKEMGASVGKIEKPVKEDNPVLGKKTNPIMNKLSGKQVDESKPEPEIKDIKDIK